MKPRCTCSFIVMIDTQHIPLVINSYLIICKTYSINCLDRIVWQKLNKKCESWKRSKTSWMGHGAWWGLHGGKWKMGTWGLNIALETLHYMFWGLGLLGHPNACGVAHQNLTCFNGCSSTHLTYTWTAIEGLLEANNTFTIWSWNNVKAICKRQV